MTWKSFLAYFGLSSVFLFWRVDSFLKDLFVAPLYFVVPMGLGLLFARSCGAGRMCGIWMTRAQIVLCATVLGLVFQTTLYQAMERFNLLLPLWPLLYPTALFTSLLGFYLMRDLLPIDPNVKPDLMTFAALAPLAMVMYGFYFLQFTEYPLRDIFQEVHFMKGALELARFQILNPFTADSYIPVQQVHLGLLHYWYGYNLLNSQWILPIYCFLFQYGSLHCFISAIVERPMPRAIALGLCIISLQNMFSPTNGDLLFSFTLLLFSLLAKQNPSVLNVWGQMGMVVTLGVLVGLAYQVVPVQETYLYVLPLYALAPMSGRILSAPVRDFLWLGFLTLVGVILHAAQALLYLATILLSYAVFALVMNWAVSERAALRKTVFPLSITLTGGVLVIVIYNLLIGLEQNPTAQLVRMGEWILGKEITGAEGFRNTLFEWVRLATPGLHILGLTLLFIVHHVVRKGLFPEVLERREAPYSIASWDLILFYCLVSAGLVLLGFSGFPYFHRMLYFPVVFGSVAVALMLDLLLQHSIRGARKHVMLAPALVLLIYTLLSASYLYRATDEEGMVVNPYLLQISPLPGAALVTMAMLTLSAGILRKRMIVSLLACLAVAVALVTDKMSIKTMFYKYTYGDVWPQPPVLSHYTTNELSVNEIIGAYPANSILYSDPYTLGIIKAITGLNGLYTFANLGVMKTVYEEAIKHSLRQIEKVGLGNRVPKEAFLSQLEEFVVLHRGATPEIRYIYERKLDQQLDRHALQKNIIVILNAHRTFFWTKGEASYFPEKATFPKSFIDNLETLFEIVYNIDDELLILRIR